MKIISIITEQEPQAEPAQIRSYQELWSKFNQAEWTNIMFYFLEQDPTVRGVVAQRSTAIRAKVDNLMGEIDPQRRNNADLYFNRPGRFTSVLRQYGIALDSNSTWDDIYNHLAPHKGYQTSLPDTGNAAGNTVSPAPYTQMREAEFKAAVRAAMPDLPETITDEASLDAAVAGILQVMLDNENRREGTPSWRQLAIVENNRVKQAMLLILSRFQDSLPQTSDELISQLYWWMATADDMLAQYRRNNN